MNDLIPLSAYEMMALFALLGLAFGSFLNVLVTRLPIMISRQRESDCLAASGEPIEAVGPTARYDLFWPPSGCPCCQTPIHFLHNIPLLSWLWLRGRAACCGVRIPLRYPALELGGALLFVVACHRHAEHWFGALAVATAWSLMLGCGVLAWRRQSAAASLYCALWLGLLINVGAGWYARGEQALFATALAWGAAWLLEMRSADGDSELLPRIALPAAWLGWPGLALAALLLLRGWYRDAVGGAVLCALPVLLWLWSV